MNMSNKKVYCSNCVFLSDESIVVAPRLYNSLTFRDNTNYLITHGTPICSAKIEKKFEETENSISKSKRLSVIVDNPNVLNRNNNCELYKETIFSSLFYWIKEMLNKIRSKKNEKPARNAKINWIIKCTKKV